MPGATVIHPHGQISAYPFVAPRWRRVLQNAQRHRERTGQRLRDLARSGESRFLWRVPS